MAAAAGTGAGGSAIKDAIELLRSRGYSVIRKGRQMGIDTQRLWLCRWGTMTALVWAQSPENAEQRVRHQVFERTANLYAIHRTPVLVNGDVSVREATEADVRDFDEANGAVPA